MPFNKIVRNCSGGGGNDGARRGIVADPCLVDCLVDRLPARVVIIRRVFPALFYFPIKTRPRWALYLCPETCLISHVRRNNRRVLVG